MTLLRLTLVILATAWLAACSNGVVSSANLRANRDVAVTRLPSLVITSVEIRVPRTLVVSEMESYRPKADIVWRDEPAGDRYNQIKAIFQEAVAHRAGSLHGNMPVVAMIEVQRFHALTQRTRYSVEGLHAISFTLSLRNAVTGDVVVPTHAIRADLRAYGGERALAAERRGLSQRVRIVEHLSRVIESQLTGRHYTPPA